MRAESLLDWQDPASEQALALAVHHVAAPSDAGDGEQVMLFSAQSWCAYLCRIFH